MRIRQRALSGAVLTALRARMAGVLPDLPAAVAAAAVAAATALTWPALASLGLMPSGLTLLARAEAAEPGDALSVLISQGKYWQDHRRGDLAEQAWQKVLRIDPRQADALYGMGLVEADRKRPAQAQAYLVQLRDAVPNDPRIDELAQRLGESTPGSPVLDDARRLAQQGQTQAAVQKYQEAIAKGPVAPAVSLEYYQSLGATPQGWDEARRGLDTLARAHPDEPRYALALAQHLTYREATRREGIGRLQKLATLPELGETARTSWRQALLWLGGRASDEPLYQAYLQGHPDDAAVKARYDALASQEQAARDRAAAGAVADERGRAISAGFDAAGQGDLASAEAHFQDVLKQAPNDGDALGGLGVVRLKQEKFADARGYLQRAMKAGNPERWRDALKSATYWTLVSEGLGARSNGELAQARSSFEKAIATDPSEVTAQNLLGDTLMSSGDARAAEAAYRMVLRRQADNPDAIRGLVGALAAQGRGQDALQFANALTAEQKEKVGGISKLKAQAEQADARAAEASGDLGSARSLLEDALLNDPDNPWMRLDLGRVYVKQGATGSAQSLMDGLLAAHPDSPDILYAAALLAGETHDWNNGLALLQRVAPAQRTRDMAALQHRLWVNAQAAQAVTLAARAQVPAAHALLVAAEPVAAGDAGLLATLASAYAQIGDTGRALALMRGVLAQSPQQNPGLLLQYASVLLATQQETELVPLLQRLQSMNLTSAQRQDLSSLNLAVVLRRADALRIKGDLAGAFDQIAPALAARPDDPELQGALGRMYASAGEPQQALQCFQRSLSVRPGDLNTLMSAIGAGTAAHDWSSANALFEAALRIAPDDPRVLATGGRLYHAQGKTRLAAEYLRRSLVAENAPAGGATGALDKRLAQRGWDATLSGGTQPVLNPFVGMRPAGTPPAGATAALNGQAAAAAAYGGSGNAGP
jgi:cellulose synthase operon protein C